MADTATLAAAVPAAPDPTQRPPLDAGERGRLDVTQRAVERIAEITARRVDGVLVRENAFGRGLPKVKARLAGRRVRLEVEVAAIWGHSLAEVAGTVRDRVTEAVRELAALGVDGVDVDISAVELAVAGGAVDGDEPRRRVL